MRQVLLILAVGLMAPGLTGCYRMTIDAGALEPHVYLSTQARGPVEPVARFDGSATGSWLFWGLVQLEDAQVEKVVEREVARLRGDAVTGLTLRTQQRFIDAFLEAITLGIYGQRTVFVEGTVVRYAGGDR